MSTTTTTERWALETARFVSIDRALQRVRSELVNSELAGGTPQTIAAEYDAVGLAFNALWRAVKGNNAPATQAAAVVVAAAAARLAEGWRGGRGGVA